MFGIILTFSNDSATALCKWALTGLVLTLWYYLAYSWGGAGIVDSADVEVINWIGENQPNLGPSGDHPLTRGLSWRLPNGHIVAVMELFGRKLANRVILLS